MFMGEYQHTLDEKGRVIIPAKLRDDLGESFVITRGLDKSLFVYPMDEWNNVAVKMRELSTTNADARAFVRFFLSGAVEAELDKQGRVVIPNNLREHADIQKEIYILGVASRLEIWSKEVWEEYSKQAEESYESIAEKIVGLGI
jgi:MraZ protein